MKATRVELWREIPDSGGYEVSDQGRIRNPHGTVVRGTSDHYPKAYVGGAMRYIHHMVAEAFIGSRPDGAQICHNNGDPTDSRLENLRYDTPSGNNRDKRKHGTDHWANRTHCPSGHPYDATNTILYEGRRYCRPCKRRHQLEHYYRKKAASE